MTQTRTFLTEGTLSHGLRVAVRPMEHGDRADLIAGFEHLSEESKYRRFMTAKPRLSSSDVEALFDTEELALVLVWPRTSCRDIVLAIAHAIRLPEDPSIAEFCIAVTDEIHGRGGGRLLTQALAAEARDRGIERLTGVMLASNEPPARLLKSVGETEVDRITQGTREVTVKL
jgi:GNAT superfamily N-acetyltransferase